MTFRGQIKLGMMLGAVSLAAAFCILFAFLMSGIPEVEYTGWVATLSGALAFFGFFCWMISGYRVVLKFIFPTRVEENWLYPLTGEEVAWLNDRPASRKSAETDTTGSKPDA